MSERIKELFERHRAEYGKFSRVEGKAGNRPDVNAFILLDHWVSGNQDIIGSAEHDIIYLSVDLDVLERAVPADQLEHVVVTLLRCGVMFSSDLNCLAMFV